MSEGSKSGVNDILLNLAQITCERDFILSVLARPGTHSSKI